MITYLYVHPWVLRYVLLGLGLFLVAELYYLFVVRPWRQSRHYALAYSAHRKPAGRKDPVWDEAETAELDRAFARELAAARQEQLEPLPRDDIRSAWWDEPAWQRPHTMNAAPWDSAPFAAVSRIDLPGPSDGPAATRVRMSADASTRVGEPYLPGVPSDPGPAHPRRTPGDGKHVRQSNLPDAGALTSADMTTLARVGEPVLLQPDDIVPAVPGTPEEAKTGRVLAPASILPVPPWPVTVINLTIVRQEIHIPGGHVPDTWLADQLAELRSWSETQQQLQTTWRKALPMAGAA